MRRARRGWKSASTPSNGQQGSRCGSQLDRASRTASGSICSTRIAKRTSRCRRRSRLSIHLDGLPFALVKEILAYNSCEVLFNFMYEEINRFIEHPDQTKNFEELFGTDKWRAVANFAEPRARRAFLHDLYVSQLRNAADVRYVRSFEMRNKKDVTDYFLFFATNSAKGIKKMKEAMWKVDQSGEFRFSDATNPAQTLLFEPAPDFSALRRAIVERFAGVETTVAEVEGFVLAETPFRETHYKKQVLAELEK